MVLDAVVVVLYVLWSKGAHALEPGPSAPPQGLCVCVKVCEGWERGVNQWVDLTGDSLSLACRTHVWGKGIVSSWRRTKIAGGGGWGKTQATQNDEERKEETTATAGLKEAWPMWFEPNHFDRLHPVAACVFSLCLQ